MQIAVVDVVVVQPLQALMIAGVERLDIGQRPGPGIAIVLLKLLVVLTFVEASCTALV